VDLGYPYEHIGQTPKTIETFEKTAFAQQLKNTQKPVINTLRVGNERTNGASMNTGTDTKNTDAKNINQLCREEIKFGKEGFLRLSSISNVGLVAG
jgi:hypothetical protein